MQQTVWRGGHKIQAASLMHPLPPAAAATGIQTYESHTDCQYTKHMDPEEDMLLRKHSHFCFTKIASLKEKID